MALEAQNNPFPSVLMVEAADETDPTPDALPATGQRRLIVGPDHLLYLLDDAGVATAVGGAGGGDITTDPAWAAKGNLIVATANDAASVLTVGSNGQVLTADSAETTGVKWATPSAGSAGALVLLTQGTASAQATLDLTGWVSSTYDEYMVELLSLIPATDNVSAYLRIGTGAGPTYQTSDYSYATMRWSNTGAAQAGAAPSSPTTRWELDGAGGIDNSSNMGIWGSVKLFGLQDSIWKKMIGQTGYMDNSGAPLACNIAGQWVNATAVTALRFLFSSGNIASGTIRIYGVAK